MKYIVLLLLFSFPVYAANITCGTTSPCTGTSGDDFIQSYENGNITIETLGGNDTVEVGGSGTKVVNFGTGNKIFNQLQTANVTWNCGSGNYQGIVFGFGTSQVNCSSAASVTLGHNTGIANNANGSLVATLSPNADSFGGSHLGNSTVSMGDGPDTGTAGSLLNPEGTAVHEIDLGAGNNDYWNSVQFDIITAGSDNDKITMLYGDHIDDLGNGDNLFVMVGNGRLISPGGTGVDTYQTTVSGINGGSELLDFGHEDKIDFTPIENANPQMLADATSFVQGLLAEQKPVARNEAELMELIRFVEATSGPKSRSKRDLKAYRDRVRTTPRVLVYGRNFASFSSLRQGLKARHPMAAAGVSLSSDPFLYAPDPFFINAAYANPDPEPGDMFIGNLLIKGGEAKVMNGVITINNFIFP